MPFLSNFERLRRTKALAENRDISLRTVSNETGLSFSTLQRVKSETMETVNLATIEVLCRYFKVKKIGDLVEYVPQEGATGQEHPDRTSDPKAEYRPISSPGTGQE